MLSAIVVCAACCKKHNPDTDTGTNTAPDTEETDTEEPETPPTDDPVVTSYAAKITHLWVWGGTGPEYGCTKLYDLFDNERSFDSTDGRGPKALMDNYLEFFSDGSFTNWAGEDARNWCYVYKQGDQRIDVSEFYDLIPGSTATWELSQNTTMTFTSGEKTVSASLTPPGTYNLPGTDPQKTITLTNQTLAFTITGGKDDWNNAGSDLDVFVKQPRMLYVELEIQPYGFVIPAAAKTTDTSVSNPDSETP